MPVVNGINYNEKMITDLEELMILAHRINQYEEGCVFVSDRAHVMWVEFRVVTDKINYNEFIDSLVVHYDKNRLHLNNDEEIKRFKNELIKQLEDLSTKKVTPPASSE